MPFSAARVTAAIDAAVAATTHIQLHDGDPGAGGTANVADEVAGRLGFVFPAAVDGETAQTAEFAITGPGGPYSYVTGWSADSGGTHQWTAQLTPAESFAGPGTLEVTVTATGESS